jgi:predicted CoA-binding protein
LFLALFFYLPCYQLDKTEGFMEKKKTLVLGASENPSRYSNMAIRRLTAHGHPVVAIGNKAGKVDGVEIITDRPEMEDIHTITLYLNPTNQKPFYDYILSLKPKRVIFNPGTENDELERKLVPHGSTPMEACTLVMLSTGQY